MLGSVAIGIARRDPVFVVTGLVVGGVAVLLAWRIRRTKVVLGRDGILDMGLLRTRRYRWDEVHALRDAGDGGAGLTLIAAALVAGIVAALRSRRRFPPSPPAP